MKKIPATSLLLAAFFLSGCIDKKTAGDVSTFSIALWVTAAFFLGGCGAIIASRFVPKRTDRWRFLLRRVRFGLIFGGAALLFVSFATLGNKVTVTPEGFTECTGFISQSKTYKIVYRDLQKIELTKETSGIGRSKSSNYYLLCYGKDGTMQKIPASGDVMKAALSDIARAIHASGIPVTDLTGES